MYNLFHLINILVFKLIANQVVYSYKPLWSSCVNPVVYISLFGED